VIKFFFLAASKIFVPMILQMRPVAICLLLLSGPLFADINTTVDRTRLAEGETLNLLLEVQGQVSGQPDTKPLEKDFQVLGTASGSQTTITNGAVNARTTWTISLQPKHSGNITIPLLEINDQKTTAIEIEVTKAPQADANSKADVFIETEVTPESPYVQGEVRYTLRIYHAVQLELAEAELIDPAIEGAIIRKTEGEREYYKTIKDRRYRVIEIKYTLFPQASGEWVIPEAVLKARIRQAGQSNRSFGGFFDGDPFNRFSNSRSVTVRSKSHTLNVQPQPKGNKGPYWLPAKELHLDEEWDIPADEIRVGEPITRSLELSALGLTAEQLPDLKAPEIKGVNSYPDQPQNITKDTNDGVVGQKTRRIAFVPTQAGKFTIPAMEVFWWDTGKNQQQRVELPERSFSILAAEGVTSAPVEPENKSLDKASKDQKVAASTKVKTAGYWPWITLVMALLWLSTLALWFRERVSSAKHEDDKIKPEPTLSSRSAQKEFKEACQRNDPQAARTSILKWASIHWPENPPHGLSDLAERMDEQPQRQALLELNRVLYRGNRESWNGAELGRLNIVFPKKLKSSSLSKVLPPLYPG